MQASCLHDRLGQSFKMQTRSCRHSSARLNLLQPRHTAVPGRQRQLAMTVENAISRAKKEATVQKLEEAFAASSVVFGMKFKNLSVKQQEQFRHSLPKDTRMIVCKNSLLRVAADKCGGWEKLKPFAKEDNAWVFVNEEVVADSVKAYYAFERKLKEPLPREQRAMADPCPVSVAVLDGNVLEKAGFQKLSSLPTRLELYASIARSIKQVPTKLARSIKMIPTKVAVGVSKLADGDDNKELVVGDIFPKPAP